jgi:hypothetical protein
MPTPNSGLVRELGHRDATGRDHPVDPSALLGREMDLGSGG